MKNFQVLHRVKEERNSLHTITRRKTTEIGHILSWNCLLKHAFEGKEWMRRKGRRRTQLLDDFKNNISYWNLKGKTPGLTLWRTRFAWDFAPVARQTTQCVTWDIATRNLNLVTGNPNGHLTVLGLPRQRPCCIFTWTPLVFFQTPVLSKNVIAEPQDSSKLNPKTAIRQNAASFPSTSDTRNLFLEVISWATDMSTELAFNAVESSLAHQTKEKVGAFVLRRIHSVLMQSSRF